MKHVSTVSRIAPGKADLWNDIVCYSAHAIAGIVESKGGSSPIVSYIDDKCDLPNPNPDA